MNQFFNKERRTRLKITRVPAGEREREYTDSVNRGRYYGGYTERHAGCEHVRVKLDVHPKSWRRQALS